MAASLRWAGFLSIDVSRGHSVTRGGGIVFRLRQESNESLGHAARDSCDFARQAAIACPGSTSKRLSSAVAAVEIRAALRSSPAFRAVGKKYATRRATPNQS